MISPERIEAMQTGWVRLVSQYGVTPADAYPVFDRLVAAYSESHRHYHTLVHLADMFRVASRLADASTPMDGIFFAIWFHDVVYDPKAKDNEARSADTMHDWLKPFNLPDALLSNVRQMILATAHAGDIETDDQTAILLDADLAILAADEWRYTRYADAIRQEYSWVPDDAYRAGRKAVLQAFLGRPRIYRTLRFHEMGDESARRNLNWEIETLLR